MGSLGGFYLFLILALILALMIVPRWGKTDTEKLQLMSKSLEKAISHLEAAAGKAAKTEQDAQLIKAISETRRLGESKDVKQISAGALVLANSTLRDLLKEPRESGVNISGDIDDARKDLRDAAGWDRPSDYSAVFSDPNIRYSAKLSFVSCTISALLSLWIAVPIGYLMSRFQFRGKNFIDTILDVPIVLPPLVIGLGLLILFNNISFGTMDVAYVDADGSRYVTEENRTLERMLRELAASLGLQLRVTNGVIGVILAQFMVACAFAVRTMRNTFDQINPRQEEVAMTLGSSRGEAFWTVVLPQAYRGVLAAGTLAWARSLGEFGPILIFCGIFPQRTEVMSSSVYLLFSVGEIEKAAVVSLFMILLAFVVLMLIRYLGKSDAMPHR
tara:strand:- start:212 stop:1375 length:1164 start_codon:yes stop_codon:yes gene_type:complete